MSGIAVIWNRDGRPVERAQLVRMTDLMEHRGPDGAHHLYRGDVAMGHRALKTTAESRDENQPLSDEAAGLCLTFDGRVDNREELLSLLDLEGLGPHQDSDAALVIAAYRKWGEECPAHLLGDFAFAIWDERRKQLFCARDPLGVRPLFYAIVGSTFACASEIRALFALPNLLPEPNLPIIALRLMRKCVEFDDTIYKGICRLPLAHCLMATRDAVRQRRYWDIDPRREIRYRNDDEYAQHFRELFFDSVECRLRSAAPIAAMLSGGLDSSSIVCSAQRIRGEKGITEPKLETFSMVFDRLSLCDERPFINEVIKHCQSSGHFYVADQHFADAAIDRHRQFPGLLYTPHAMLLTSVLETVKAGNFRVLLDGTGGDELAGSFFRHLASLLRRGKWSSLSAFIREYSTQYRIPFWTLVLDMAVRPAIPAPLKELYRSIIPAAPAPVTNLVREDALTWTGARARMTKTPAIPAFPTPMQSEMYAAIFVGWAPTVLTEEYELAASYFGIELRQPFRDRRLVEFALALPFDQLWRDGRSRFAFRNAMKHTLPEPIRRRRGKGMFLTLYDSVLAGTQASEVRALFDHSILVSLGIADSEAIQSLLRRYQASPDLGSTLKVCELVVQEIACRDMVGENTN